VRPIVAWTSLASAPRWYTTARLMCRCRWSSRNAEPRSSRSATGSSLLGHPDADRGVGVDGALHRLADQLVRARRGVLGRVLRRGVPIGVGADRDGAARAERLGEVEHALDRERAELARLQVHARDPDQL